MQARAACLSRSDRRIKFEVPAVAVRSTELSLRHRAGFKIIPSSPVSCSRQFFVHGITATGRPFRPSDWAERLCGVLAAYRPGGISAGRDAMIGYSPYARPIQVGGVKCVMLDERLKAIEPMAFEFVLNFARDNGLPVYEGCELPEPGSKAR